MKNNELDILNEIIPEGTQQATLFRQNPIRRVLHNGEWWYSVVDIIEALTDSDRPSKYWSDLKKRLENEGFSELSEIIGQLKMEASDGKFYETDAVRPEDLLRIIQAIPSKKAEPFKKWMAKVGYERIQETQNPDIAIKRAIFLYKLKGADDEWIDARVKSIVVRNELTKEWSKRGVRAGLEYALLTDEISKEAFGLTTNQHKDYKSLNKKHTLRDHMTSLELLFNSLGEKSTTEIAKKIDARGFGRNKEAARRGGRIAGDARRKLEQALGGEKIVSNTNYLTEPPRAKKLPLEKNKKSDKPS